MPTSRRQFIKRGAGLVTISLVMPRIWIADANAQANPARKITVIIQLAGGWDGLNVVVPYTNSRYQQLRPNLHFKDSELVDEHGGSTIIDGSYALHPRLAPIKALFDEGRVAIVHGVGYPDPNLSHFLSMDIYHTANPNGGQGDGWLGKYADETLAGQSGLSAVNVGGSLPKSLFGDRVVIPSIANFATYTYQTDPRNPADRGNQINTFNATNGRQFPRDTLSERVASTGLDALGGAAQLQAAVANYSSTVVYPDNNPLAGALRMAAQIVTTIPEANLLYVQMGGFDHHAQEIGNPETPADKKIGQLATLLGYFAGGIKAFYDDMEAHGLADNVLMMQWTEFGRRPNENASFGTDHGTAAPMMVLGNPVRGGLYGEHPSLEATQLDRAGNMVFSVDFRAVYATILAKWLGADSETILGGSFEDIGFMG